MKYKLEFITDYQQFYLSDKDSPQSTDSVIFWTDQAYIDKLAIEVGILGIGIGNSEGIVNCEIEILESKNQNPELNRFDHVVEGSLKINSEILQVLDCPFSTLELEIKLTPDEYRVRSYSSNLSSIYDEKPKDKYFIEIWPEKFAERVVLKRYLE